MAKITNPKFEFRPLDDHEINRNLLGEAREAVKQFVLESVLGFVADGKSPVGDGGSFQKLSKKYAKDKKGGSDLPDLRLTSDMLDALNIRVKGNVFTLLVDDNSQAGKSDGHNNFSSKSKLPERRFIPISEDENFNDFIQSGIDDIASEYETMTEEIKLSEDE